MKPHSLRRVLWLANLGLAAAVVGVLAYFVLEVKPAVAKVTNRPVNHQPKEYQAMRKDYDARRLTGLKWAPPLPVLEKDLTAVILRPDYKRLKPTHWIFSGPLPPAEVADTGPAEAKPPAPEGLDSIGKITMIIIRPPASSILFEFSGAKRSLPFKVGEFVQASPQEPERFLITAITRLRERVYEVKYDVFGDDRKKPERSATLLYDQSTKANDYPAFLRPADLKPPAAPATGEPVAAGTGTAAAKDGAGAADPDEKSADEGGESSSRVLDAASKPADQITPQDFKVTWHEDPRNARNRAVEFDDNTYRYFRGRNANSIAESVKTMIAKEPGTGRVIGLRVTGFTENDAAAATAFDVKRGDILVSINGQKVGSRSEAIAIAQKLDPNKLVTVVIDRNGRLITTTVDPRDPHTKRKIRYFENLR